MLETALKGLTKRQGKVRDVYELEGDRLLFIATDRISAFDWVMPNGIPDKGRVLNALSAWWFAKIQAVPNHVISTNLADAKLPLDEETRGRLDGRSMIVRKVDVIPFECVVRGYLSGSGWKEYRTSGTVCGERFPAGLRESERIDPIFTPATKAKTGHDENVSFSKMTEVLGPDLAEKVKRISLTIYREAARFALEGDSGGHVPGLILADTKFEFGVDRRTGELLLVDEVLTPDSSRYWPAGHYKPGGAQPSFDKQYVRDWLETTGWDKASPPPALPADVVSRTREKYVEAYETLTGRPFFWK